MEMKWKISVKQDLENNQQINTVLNSQENLSIILSHAVPNLWLNTKYNVQRLLEKHAVLSVDNIDVPPSGIILVQEIVLPFTQHDTRDGISMMLPVTSEDFKGNLYLPHTLNCERHTLQNIKWNDRVKQSACISFCQELKQQKNTNSRWQ